MKTDQIRSLREKIEHLEKQKLTTKGQKLLDLYQAIVDAEEKLKELLYPKAVEL